MPKKPVTKNKEDDREDIEETKTESFDGKTYLGVDLEKLTSQIKNEYELAYKHQQPKKIEQLARLKLYNNQKKDKKAVGDTTMFSIFQTVFASLYNDRLMVDFRGREDGDEETADNLNAMAKSDYDDMEKDVLDYDWTWNTCFFGRALIDMEEYHRDADKKEFYPLPFNIDPATWLRDPSAISVNGNRQGMGAMRFGGNEIKMSRQDIDDHPAFFNRNYADFKYGTGTYSLLQDAAEAHNQAQGHNTVNKNTEADLGDNAEYTITQWFTHTEIDGELKKVKVWLANDRSMIIGLKIIKRDYWPLVDRALYPHSNDWDGTSIPDLTEDKQRARAIAQNLSLKAMKANLYPMYVYNSNKITNRNDLNITNDFEGSKFIGVDGVQGESVGNYIQPMQRANPNMQLLDFIYQTLDASAQKATATSDIKMGIQSQQQRTLGEQNLIASGSDSRYSLAAKVFGWSEKRFWRQWYNLHKDNLADGIDEKVLRIVGAFGAKWRKLSKEDIICNLDPDVYIESVQVSRAKDMEDRISLGNFFAIALQDPTTNRRWALKKQARINGLEKDEIDRLFPPTVDERIATDQNDLLNEDKLVPVLPEDDHNVHLEIHAMAKDTKAAKAHIETHKKALSIKKTRPELFPSNEQMQAVNNINPNTEPVTGINGVTPSPITPSMTSGQQ